MPIDSPRAIHLRGVRTHNLKGIGPRPASQSSDRGDRRQRLGEELAGLRHDLRGGPAALRRDLFALRRQFLEKLDKPDADRIDGIPPAIAVGQSHGRHSGRSTVGTITEIHDALGLLFARAGEVICRNCGSRVQPATPATVSPAIDALPAETRYEIAFPMDLRPETDRQALDQCAPRRGVHPDRPGRSGRAAR